MLVMTRKADETIVFPELGIEIVVLEIKSKGIMRIGVKAPENVLVLRGEIPTKNGMKRIIKPK